MDVALAVIVIIVGVSALWHTRWPQSPQALAFGTTFGAILFLVTGFFGYALQKGPPLLAESRWTNAVIWPQVALGTAFLIAAVFCWRRAISDVDRRLRR